MTSFSRPKMFSRTSKVQRQEHDSTLATSALAFAGNSRRQTCVNERPPKVARFWVAERTIGGWRYHYDDARTLLEATDLEACEVDDWRTLLILVGFNEKPRVVQVLRDAGAVTSPAALPI